jgi:hypothetical protein
MSAAAPDFVQVQLTAAGVAFAGAGGYVRIANGHFAYTFTAVQPVRVLSSEWARMLSRQCAGGAPILQLAVAAAKAASTGKRVIKVPASHTDAPQSPVVQPTSEVK